MVALSGSCSNATRAQVAAHGGPKREVSAEEALGGLSADTLADWALAQDGLPLIYSSAEPATVAALLDGEWFGRTITTRPDGSFEL